MLFEDFWMLCAFIVIVVFCVRHVLEARRRRIDSMDDSVNHFEWKRDRIEDVVTDEDAKPIDLTYGTVHSNEE